MENGFDLSQLAQVGEAAGRAYAVFYQAFLDGFTDQYGCKPPTPQPTPAATEDATEPCPQCWCNTCAKLDDCDAFPCINDIMPPPCAACPQGATVPLMPRDAPAECGTYSDGMPEDCKACWCSVCAVLEECPLAKAGYSPDRKPCPCEECRKGQRWMPKENPPCEHFTKRE